MSPRWVHLGERHDGNGNYYIRAGDIPADGQLVYVELTRPSSALRDYRVGVSYDQLGWDTLYMPPPSALAPTSIPRTSRPRLWNPRSAISRLHSRKTSSNSSK
jgi:hypothetical protein